MAQMGNSQSEASGENTAPTNSATNDAPAADGSGEKLAQAPTSPAKETTKLSTDSSAILSAAGGEPLNVEKVIPEVAQSKPDAAVKDDAVLPATPPATPISGDVHPLSIPSIPDPIIIQSPVSTTPSADLIDSSILIVSTSDAPIDAGTPQTTLTNDVATDSAVQKALILPDAPAPVVTVPVDTSSPVSPEPVVTDPPGPTVISVPESGTPGPVNFPPQAAPSVPVVPLLTDVAVSLATVAKDIIPTNLGEGVNADSGTNDEWIRRESELLGAVSELEKAKSEAASDAIKLKLKAKDDEIELLKARVNTLETELTAALTRPGARNHELVETIKQQHEELLSRARGMIFDKTKIVKNQELQIAALTAQIASLKDVNSITKDLLEIRNSEIKHLEERMEGMEGRFKAEKERHMLVLKRAETGQSINNDLRTEYETQLKLFKELREKYDQRVQALVAENKRLSEASGATAPSPST